MRRFLKLRKLNQRGFDHVLLGLAFAVVIALGGTYYLLVTRAATPYELLSGDKTASPYCLNEQIGGVVNNAPCNGNAGQKYGFDWSNGELELNAGCVAVQGATGSSLLGTGKIIVVPSASDSTASGTSCSPKAPWGGVWTPVSIGNNSANQAGYIFENSHTGNKFCLEAVGSTVGIDVCNKSVAAQQWFYAPYKAPTATSTSTTAPGCTTASSSDTPCTPGEITFGSDANMCVTAGSSATGAVTLAQCNGNSAQQWTQLASNGSSQVFYNLSLKTYLGRSGTNVVGSTSPPGNTTWTAEDDGDGTDNLDSTGNAGNCLNSANGDAAGALTIAGCANPNSSWTLPLPYSAPAPQSSGSSSGGSNSGSSGNCTFAATAAACESELSSGGSTTFTPSNPSTSTTTDLSALLQALKASGYTFDCNSLSVTNRTACTQILGNS